MTLTSDSAQLAVISIVKNIKVSSNLIKLNLFLKPERLSTRVTEYCVTSSAYHTNNYDYSRQMAEQSTAGTNLHQKHGHALSMIRVLSEVYAEEFAST